MAKLRVVAKRHKIAWRHKGAERGVAHKRKTAWSYLKRDTGKRGRTPPEKRWWKSDRLAGKLGEGYTDLPADTRHNKLRRLDSRKDISSRGLWNHMQGLANITVDREAKQVFQRDANWVMEHMMDKQERQEMTRAARKHHRNYGIKKFRYIGDTPALFFPGKKIKDLTAGEMHVEFHDEDRELQRAIEEDYVQGDTYNDLRRTYGKAKAKKILLERRWDPGMISYLEEKYDEEAE